MSLKIFAILFYAALRYQIYRITFELKNYWFSSTFHRETHIINKMDRFYKTSKQKKRWFIMSWGLPQKVPGGYKDLYEELKD